MDNIALSPYADALHREQVIALWQKVFRYDAPHNRPALSIDKKIAFDDGLFFVAVAGAEVIGTAMAGYDGHRGWIYSVAVSPAHQRGGIGAKLVRFAERALAAKGCVKVNLQIMDGNDAVTAFYEALGFSVEKRISMSKRITENIPAK